MNFANHPYKKTFSVLSISKSDKEEFIINVSNFLQTKDQINLNNNFVYYTLDQVFSQLKKEIPLVIVFCGEDVITRYSNNGEMNLFEEIQQEDFYNQDVQFSLGWKLQTIIRKEFVDNILKMLILKGFYILGFSLGVSSIQSIEDQISTSEFNIGGISFKLNNGQITDISTGYVGESNLTIGDEIYDENGTIMISCLLSYIKGETLSLPLIQSSAKEYSFLYLNKKILPIFIGFLLIILLTNFLVFNHISENLKKVKNDTKEFKEKFNQIKSLETKIDEYVNIKASQKTNKEASLAYLADRVALQKPEKLWFNKFNIYPVSSRMEEKKPITIKTSVLAVKGNIKTPEVLNMFIGNLKKEPWIKDIQLMDYQWKSDKTYAEFEISILKQ